MCENIFTSLQLTHMNDSEPKPYLHSLAAWYTTSTDRRTCIYYVLAIFNGFYFNFSTVKNDSIVGCRRTWVCVCATLNDELREQIAIITLLPS